MVKKIDPIKQTELFKAMKSSEHYEDDAAIVECIEEMRRYVRDGQNPEEVLHDEGFEPDYFWDII